jgi:hypothetical protein
LFVFAALDATEIRREGFDLLHARILSKPVRDARDRAHRNSGAVDYRTPLAFAGVQPLDDVLMEGFMHGLNFTPILGTLQAKYGSAAKLGYLPMPRSPRPTYLAALQSALADNVRVLMDRKWPQLSSKDDRITELAKLAGIGRNTVYRIVDPEGAAKDGAYVYPRLDNIAALARSVGVSAADLLTPEFAVRNPPAAADRRRPKPAA